MGLLTSMIDIGQRLCFAMALLVIKSGRAYWMAGGPALSARSALSRTFSAAAATAWRRQARSGRLATAQLSSMSGAAFSTSRNCRQVAVLHVCFDKVWRSHYLANVSRKGWQSWVSGVATTPELFVTLSVLQRSKAARRCSP